MTKQARSHDSHGSSKQFVREKNKDLSAIDWLRDQIVNDNDLEICGTEEERVKMLAMLSRQKKRRKAIADD